jgi:hypothetical protein
MQGELLMEKTRRVVGSAIMFVVLSVFGCLAYVGYAYTGDTDMLATSVLSWCIAVFFAWVFIFKKEEWLKERLNDFF